MNITFSMCKSIHLPLYGFWVVIFFFKSWFKRTLPPPHYEDISTPPSHHFCHCYHCYCYPAVPLLCCSLSEMYSVTWVWSGPNSGVAHCLYYFCVHKTIIEVDFGHKKTFMIHSWHQFVLITSWKDPISKQGPILRSWGFNIWIGGVGEQQWP